MRLRHPRVLYHSGNTLGANLFVRTNCTKQCLMDSLKIFSMNCRGLSSQQKRRDVVNYIRGQNYSIVFLQDTHITQQSLPYFNNLWKGKCVHSCYNSSSRGSCILISRHTQHETVKEITSKCGNYVIIIAKINSETFAFVCIYGPNNDQPSFYDEVFTYLTDVEVDYIVVGGDLNFTIDPKTDTLNYVRENNVNAKRKFLQLAHENSLVDIWRRMHPDEQEYTWTRRNPYKCGRLDMFFVSEQLVNRVLDANIIPGYRTDHFAITLTLKTKQHTRGNGLWMFNVSHLQKEEYINRIKSCIHNTLRQYAVPIYDPNVYTNCKNYSTIQLTITECLFYETLIMMLRGESVKFSKETARQNKIIENQLKKDIDAAQEKYSKSALESDLNTLELAKNSLEEFRSPIIEGLIVRSRVAWHEHGERSSKYFLALEKRNACAKSIEYISDGNQFITKIDSILRKFSEHMEAKYSRDEYHVVDEKIINDSINGSLGAADRAKLECAITFEELTKAIAKMKKGKTPGSNGFPIEFFRTFWCELGPFLHRAFLASLTKQQVLQSHREGIIKLIPKPGKSPHDVKGWRPITLLNVDYKIVSTAIAIRLKSIINKIISPCQTAYISGRYIGENTRLVYDTVAAANKNKIKGVIAAADFEAAFESVSWEYLTSVLKRINFGTNFIEILKLMYLNHSNFSRIMINGHLGPQVFLHRGIRQGDPSSGYLFNIAVEVLTGLVNHSSTLKGIEISPSKQIRIAQYADDTILFLDGSQNSMKGAMNELDKFTQISGLKINLCKTSCLPIGTMTKEDIPTDLGVKVVEELKVLGITISNNLDNITLRNIEEKMPALRRDLQQWKRRNLTPIGKICIIKTLLISKLVHFFIALPNPPNDFFKNIESILFDFVWHGRKDKIKRTKLMQTYELDGLKMVNMRAFVDSMKLSWIKRMITSTGDWIEIAKTQLTTDYQLLMYGKDKLKLVKNKITNKFYVDIIDALIRFTTHYRPTNKEILTDTIWFSDHSGFSKSIIRDWNVKGLRFISDLFDPITGRIRSRENLKDIFKIEIDFLLYERLVRHLPQIEIANVSEDLASPNIPYKVQAVMNGKQFTKQAYNIHVKSLTTKNEKSNQRVKNKWERDTGQHVIGTSLTVMNATKSTFLHYFHYKIVTRIYPTNKLLLAMNIAETSECSFCQEYTETLAHMFWYCPIMQKFVEDIRKLMKRNYQKTINPNIINWFFLTDVSIIDALILTVAKYVIHLARINSSTPTVATMMNVLKMEAKKEYYVSISTGNSANFENKWGKLAKIISDDRPP